MSGLAHAFAPTVADAAAHVVADAAAVAAAMDEAPADVGTGARSGLSRASRQWLRDLVLVVALAGLVVLAWHIGQRGWVRPQEPLGYWIGVAGATMMLLLFLYPLRKYAAWMRRAGKVKGWFWFHLVMGVAGPWLVLVHAAFRTGSLNAAVALYSMAVVVASGVIGRFLYVRLNMHLDDALATLLAVRRKAGLPGEGGEGGGQPALHYAEAVQARLEAFEARELRSVPGLLRDLRQVMLLPMQKRLALWRCLRELRTPLAARAAAGRWSSDEYARRQRRLQRLIDDHLEAIVRVARHQAFGRVFALWHVAHLPFVVLLAISAVVHVIAVHAY